MDGMTHGIGVLGAMTLGSTRGSTRGTTLGTTLGSILDGDIP